MLVSGIAVVSVGVAVIVVSGVTGGTSAVVVVYTGVDGGSGIASVLWPHAASAPDAAKIAMVRLIGFSNPLCLCR